MRFYTFESWVIQNEGECPRQQNDVDCGVHVAINAALLGLGRALPSTYSQEVYICNIYVYTLNLSANISSHSYIGHGKIEVADDEASGWYTQQVRSTST